MTYNNSDEVYYNAVLSPWTRPATPIINNNTDTGKT